MRAADPCDPGQLREMLRQAGFHFSRGKSQNFLTASWVPERIARMAALGPGEGVVEIGPGAGCLTRALADRAGAVLAYELDGTLRPVLEKTLAGYGNITVLYEDVLRRDLPEDVRRYLAGLRPVVCANLPYAITTPVLAALYRSRCFAAVTVMVQQEVAERLCAGAGEKAYGAFTLLTAWYAAGAEILFSVPPSCFTPRPGVTSAVVQLTMRKEPPGEVPEEAFFAVVRAVFNQRRKTLVNSLQGLCGRDRARAAVERCGWSPSLRGECLGLEDFIRLTRTIEGLQG